MLMRIWVFVLSFYLVFGQIYQAHALLPAAVATARGVGVLVKAGVVAHGASALAGATYKWCKSNKKTCASIIGAGAELILGDDDDDGQYCYYLTNYLKSTKASTPLSSCDKYLQFSHVKSVVYDPNIKGGPNDNGKCFVNDVNGYTQYDFWVTKVCEADPDGTKKQEQRERELWDKLKDKLSDDDITNIVNNYGDDIDIDKYCASGATCYFIEPDFEKEINNNDYDIDKIDDKNCNTRNGKIYSCPDARKKKDRDDDDDGQTNNDDDDKRDDGQTEKDKDDNGLPIPRLPNFVMPEFCTWAKWFCEDEVKKTDGEINIDNDDLPADSVNINFGGACPASHNFPFRLGGYTFTFTMSYTYICQIAQSMGFIVKVLSTIVATYILLGIKS